MGRGIESNAKMKEERQRLIRSHALRLFALNGLAATKISHIAKAAGMSQGLMYHYYQSKEEIYVELIGHAFERMNQAVRELEAMNLSPKEKLELAVKELLAGFKNSDEVGFTHLLIAQATASEAIPLEAKKIIEKENRIPYQVIRKIVEEGQQSGEIIDRDPEALTLMFWTCIKGLALHTVTHGKEVNLPDPEMLMRIFI